MNLYKHQSTFNPNMPTRALLYFAKLYEKYIAAHEINIYSSAPKKLPFPQHIVFFNGSKDKPDRQILRLSDLFKKPSADLTPCLECTSLMLNINYGHNQDQEKYEKAMKQEGYEDGYNAGKSEGYNSGRTDGYSAGREDGLRQLISALMDIREKYGMSDNEIVSEIMQKYSLTKDEAVIKIAEFRAG